MPTSAPQWASYEEMKVETQQSPVLSTSTNSDDRSTPTSKPLRRACDCCRKRKVRCDGDNPCGPCKKATIRCAYLQAPKKKGPKGLRSARVLHALRTINDHVSGSPTSPTPTYHTEQNGAFGNWAGFAQRLSPNGVSYAQQDNQPHDGVYGPHTSVPPDQNYCQPSVTSMAQSQPQQYTSQPMQYMTDSRSQTLSAQPESLSGSSDVHSTISPSNVETIQHRISNESFLPYIHLFFSHMFPIMPIIERHTYLNPSFYNNSNLSDPDIYSFLCSICAATVVQLDESIAQPPPLHPNKRTDDLFAEECLRERRTYDYIGSQSTMNAMTSFFMFAYYGNHEQHAKAWHYLQESITFTENLNMEDERSYSKLDPAEAQWRRRLYWLLFITERAYAVQRRKHTRLHANVHLPSVFDSEDPLLLNGFVNLANLFSAVDDDFVRAWRGSRRQSLCNDEWLSQTQKGLDAAALALGNISETQRMDISVTREWLHVLAWQMGVSNGLICGNGEGGLRLEYPIEIAKKVIEITSGANALALDSHGIGMEQKLSDIAGCLADVLKCIAGETSATFLEGKQYLNILLQKLSSMRGKESRYLKPLMAKMEGLMGYEMNQTLPLPTETPMSFPTNLPHDFLSTQRRSMAESLGMLRTLSMSGSLGMPSLDVPMLEWTPRRPSGKVYNEAETDAMESWMLGGGIAQAV